MLGTSKMERLKYKADVKWKKGKHSGAREEPEQATYKTNEIS